MMGTHWATSSNPQKELLTSYVFFVSHHSHNYALAQENTDLTQQLLFSNFREVNR